MARMELAHIVAIVVLASIAASADCSLLLPEQFHCSTELAFYHRDLSAGDVFFIDEYVDRPNRRSSLRLVNDKGVDLIYYNQLFGEEEGPIDRHFVQYNPNKLTCARQDIYEWYLGQLRKLVIAILPTNHVSPKNVDIAIGSSGLLFAVESRMADLQYRGSLFDASRLTVVDVYETFIIKPFGASYNSGKDLLLQVSTMSPPDNTLLAGVAVLGKSLADAAKVPQYRMTIVSVRVCSVSAAKVRRQTKLLEPYVCQTNLLDGPEQDLVASIDLIEDLVSDSLIGQSLEKIGQVDFDQNPFVQPVGIGCGQPSRFEHNRASSSVKSMTFKAVSNQFSGEYFSLRGLKGLAFVAFDGERQVMRHDRGGRKNIYDLRQARSYHVDEFHSVQSMFDSSQSTNCVELDIGDDMLLADESISVMARLLGIDSEDEANYMGSRTIGEETFSVYELELQPDKNSPNSFNLPILMEPNDFVMPLTNGPNAKRRHRFFMTYHVLQIPQDSPEDTVKIPRFLELWQLSEETDGNGGVSRERSLINLLEFTQFSWSLNVEPDGSDAAASSGDLSRLFSIDSCAMERSEQLLLNFNTVYSTVPAELIRANKHKIRESFHQQLAGLLDIPRLNLLSLDFHFSPPFTGIWMIKAHVAELVRGISQDKLVGHLQFARSSNWLTAAQLFRGENRHSLDQCKLDSLALRGKPNSIVFCPGLTLCLLVDSQAVEENRADLYEKEQANKLRSADDKDAVCEVHQFSWRPTPGGQTDAVLSRVFENKNRIMSSNFEVELVPPTGGNSQGQTLKPVKYQGFGHGLKVQMLDDTVGRSRGQGSPLTGLRYLAASEVKQAGNSNYAYKLTKQQQQQQEDSSFRQCHMACQMDEFCESFSVCKPFGQVSPSDGDYDCVLSTMRLTQNKVDELANIIREEASSGQSVLSIEVQRAGSSSTSLLPDDSALLETYKFRRDSGCSVHPKDILAQFKVAKALELPLDLDSTDRDLIRANGADVVSLDECAGIANEAALLGSNSVEAEFVYCPLESLCLTGEQSLKANGGQSSESPQSSPSTSDSEPGQQKVEKCFVYTKSHHKNFYDYLLFHKVSLTLNGSHALEDDSVQEIGRVIEGLSLEQCARDCNLQQAHCLAFDMCEFETNVTVCTLWTIRSPLGPKTKAGYLPGERRFYADSNSMDMATLVENGKCAHFHLKDSYFQLKLNHMLEGNSQVKREKLNELEQKILDLDSKSSDAMMMHSVLDSNKSKANDDNSDSNSGSSAALRRRQVKEHSWLIHLGLIISSGVLGALGYLYGGEAYTVAANTIDYLKDCRGRIWADNHISRLNLLNNQDL